MASTMTMIMTTMLLFVLHVAPVWEVITMASGDKAVLTAVRATVVNKGNFPVIKCYPGTTTNDPIRCDSSGRVTVMLWEMEHGWEGRERREGGKWRNGGCVAGKPIDELFI